jgi:hypothetical protein
MELKGIMAPGKAVDMVLMESVELARSMRTWS